MRRIIDLVEAEHSGKPADAFLVRTRLRPGAERRDIIQTGAAAFTNLPQGDSAVTAAHDEMRTMSQTSAEPSLP
jgi:hypothetical protein